MDASGRLPLMWKLSVLNRAKHQNFPGLVDMWYKIESILFATFGYQTHTTKAMKDYEQVGLPRNVVMFQ